MARLEQLTPTTLVKGILPDAHVEIVSVEWHGSDAMTLVYRGPNGRVADEILYRHDEPRIEIVESGRPWSFDGDGALFRLVSEAHRIRLAHLFDPVLAVHTSLVDPLPHQITAVYEAMLPRQPLRFLLADDPGAGKTIMAGLLIKELIARGDLRRCLIVCPGSLVEQWQDELHRRFHLPFEILTNDKLEAARTGNWFLENDLCIARLDKLSRNEDVQQKLAAPDCRYDLIVCDEAHKLSATFFNGEVKRTKRYNLGLLLSGLTRHFLLMTATPHNGKEEDFQLFLALLDGDRFEGKFRDGVHQVEVSDLMRRMVKENLLKFDGRPLFPERIAYTVPYKLSDAEARLYKEVTDYVRQEFNRAEALQNDKRAGTVGFALTILQRRLASSPEAIFQSLRRRRERLEKRIREVELMQRGAVTPPQIANGPQLDDDDVEDLEEAPENEIEQAEEEILDQATAASTIAELKAEITTLTRLESLAADVRRSGQDTKWRELGHLLGVIFTPTALGDRLAEDPVPYGAGPLPPPNPFDILMVAHGLGLGLYNKSGEMQMTDKRSTWEAIGYSVEGEFRPGQNIKLTREQNDSRNLVHEVYTGPEPILKVTKCENREQELSMIHDSIVRDIKDEGVKPEDIVVISLETTNIDEKFRPLQHALWKSGVQSIIPGVAEVERDRFGEQGKVTLSTVFKVKGNEAFVIYIMYFDYLYRRLDFVNVRNRVFTSLSRTKGWCRIYGTGAEMVRAGEEIDKIKSKLPSFEFIYPPPEKIMRSLSREELAQNARKRKGNKNALRSLKEGRDLISKSEAAEALQTLKTKFTPEELRRLLDAQTFDDEEQDS